MDKVWIFVTTIMLSGCSIVGEAGVESAPYNRLKTAVDNDTGAQIEIREYPSMVLVSTSMEDGGRSQAFRRLFNFITGNNQQRSEISMTAPVYMANSGTDIEMTAPVFMGMSDSPLNQGNMMSFVMPKHFSYESTPKPLDEKLHVSEVKDYKVAAITFSWTLSPSNVKRHSKILLRFLEKHNYTIVGQPFTAAYNGPMTLPMFRKNEVLIPIK